MVSNSPESSGSIVFTLPFITSPVVPLIVIQSFFLSTSPSLVVTVPSLRFILRVSQPATHARPIPLATTAACDVIPPRLVNIPFAACIPSISSGVVSGLTSITSSPECASSAASAESKMIFPVAAPGEAGRPLAMTSTVSAGSIIGWSS